MLEGELYTRLTLSQRNLLSRFAGSIHRSLLDLEVAIDVSCDRMTFINVHLSKPAQLQGSLRRTRASRFVRTHLTTWMTLTSQP